MVTSEVLRYHMKNATLGGPLQVCKWFQVVLYGPKEHKIIYSYKVIDYSHILLSALAHWNTQLAAITYPVLLTAVAAGRITRL